MDLRFLVARLARSFSGKRRGEIAPQGRMACGKAAIVRCKFAAMLVLSGLGWRRPIPIRRSAPPSPAKLEKGEKSATLERKA